MLKNFFLGPFYDLGRFITGIVAGPPPTRSFSRIELGAVRRIVTDSGCDLSRCTVENLHIFPVKIEPGRLFDMLMAWQQWPCSSFFPCPSTDGQGVSWFAYRWWKVMPIVKMKLSVAERPSCIIYDIVWGIGPGGYHSFLIGQAGLSAQLRPGLDPALPAQTTLAIFTTLPKTWLFPEGLHDRVNYDICRKLQSSTQRWS